MIRGEYTYTCDVCGEEYPDRDTWTAYLDAIIGCGPPLTPGPPLGWIVVNGRLVCDKHDVNETTLADALGITLEDRAEFNPVDGQVV